MRHTRILSVMMLALLAGSCAPAAPSSGPASNPSSAPEPRFYNWPTFPEQPQFSSLNTLAGDDFAEFKDGRGSEAAFSYPWDVAVNSRGDLFVADRFNHRIRKVTTDGQVTTFAGKGEPSHRDGSAEQALFNRPSGIVIDANDNLYIADDANHVIRKITPGGEVSTLAGQAGKSGHQDGAANQALFHAPMGLFIDAQGTLFVADTLNHRIRKISPTGQVSTLAGTGKQGLKNGPASESEFRSPRDIVVSPTGTIYVTDGFNHVIRKIENQSVTTFAGAEKGYKDAKGTESQFNEPVGLAIDLQGRLYVADTLNHRIRRITPEGEVTTLAGTGLPEFSEGEPLKSRVSAPRGLGLFQGQIYIADTQNQRIRHLK